MHFVATPTPASAPPPARAPREPLTLAALARPVDQGAARASFVTTRLPLAAPPPQRPPMPPPPPRAPPPEPITVDERPRADAVTFVAALFRLLASAGRTAAEPPVEEEPGRFALIEVD